MQKSVRRSCLNAVGWNSALTAFGGVKRAGLPQYRRTKEHSSIFISRHLSTLLLNAHDQRQNYVIQGRSTNKIVACRLQLTLTLTNRLLSCVSSRRILFVSNHKCISKKKEPALSLAPRAASGNSRYLDDHVVCTAWTWKLWRALTSVLSFTAVLRTKNNEFLPQTGRGIPRRATKDTTGPHGMSTRLASPRSGTAT
jgi:hypothetical protein